MTIEKLHTAFALLSFICFGLALLVVFASSLNWEDGGPVMRNGNYRANLFYFFGGVLAFVNGLLYIGQFVYALFERLL